MNKLLILIFFLGACSFKKNNLENQTQKGHEELYSEPNEISKAPKNLKRIVIAATNDMEGAYGPQSLEYSDSSGSGTIQAGGVDVISSYFSILRKKYSNILLLDSGDIFSSEASQAATVGEFYSALGYDAFTIGLSDFNVKVPKGQNNNTNFFKSFARTSKTPLLLSNLYDLKSGMVVEWEGSHAYIMKEIDGTKVGIIGLVPDDIVSQTPVDNRVGLYVESMLQSTLRHARLMRSLGAEIIVVLTPQALNCGEEIASSLKLPIKKVNFEPKAKKVCDTSSQLGEYLQRLPPHLVDVVIGGRNHQKVANYVNETLVLSSFGQGMSFSYVEFFIDKDSKKLAKDKTIVHQPVLFCREFFKETKDCYNEDTSFSHKEKMPATFLGEKINPDEAILKIFENYLKNATPSKNKTTMSHELIKNSLLAFSADVSYFKHSNGHTQLLVLELTKKEITGILEEEFNNAQEGFWIPTPFQKKNNEINIVIGKDDLVKVLSDLETIQKHHYLKKFITNNSVHPLMTYSLNSILKDELDEVSVIQAAGVEL